MDTDNFKYLDFNCSLVKSLRYQFFSLGLTRPVEEKVIGHLLRCPSCRKQFEEYAKEHNQEFDTMTYALKFLKKDTEFVKDEWQNKFDDKNIVGLARSKAVRQIMLNEKDGDFADYLILEICKKLDYLELCYIKTGDEENEKS